MKNKKKNVKTASFIKKVVGKMADISCGAASVWGVYQPKEPTAARERSRS